MLRTFLIVLLFSTITLSNFKANSQTIPMAVNGDAFYLGNDDCYRLTSEINTQSGSIWALNQLDLNEDFIVDFDFYLGDMDGNGADGLAFVLQQVSTSVGSSGGQIGFGGIMPSLAVEFDTWQNGNFYDPVDDHLAIMQDGIVDHSSPNNLQGPVPILGPGINAEDGIYRNARVEWLVDSLILNVYVECDLKLSYTGDIVNDIFGGNANVFYGFTSATGGANNNHEVCINQFGNLFIEGQTICPGENALLSFSQSYTSYSWEPSNLVLNPNSAITVAMPTEPTVFELTVTDTCGNTFLIEAPVFVDNCLPLDTCIQTTYVYEYDLGVNTTGFDFLKNENGGYYLIAAKGDSVVIINHNANDQVLWLRTIKVANSNIAFLNAIYDSNNNIVGVGRTGANVQTECFAFKYNVNSNTIFWIRNYLDYDQNLFYELKERPINGNYVFTGRTQLNGLGNGEDALIGEIDGLSGNLIYNRHYDLGCCEDIFNIEINNDTIYAVGRYAFNNLNTSFRTSLTQFDNLGNEIYSKLYITDVNNIGTTFGRDIEIVNNSIYIVSSGSRNSTNIADYNIQFLNVDLQGNVISEYEFEIPGVDRVWVNDMQDITDGFLICGYYQEALDLSTFILKTDLSGNSIWAKGINLGPTNDIAFSVGTLNNNVYVVGGSSNNHTIILKFDEDGNVIDDCEIVEDLMIVDSVILNPVASDVILDEVLYNISFTDLMSVAGRSEYNLIDICADDCIEPCDDNLLPNPGFEISQDPECTDMLIDGELFFDASPVQNWIGTSLNDGSVGPTPDYFSNNCFGLNFFTCNCTSENIGFYTYGDKEYVQAEINLPLELNKTYCVNMLWRSLNDVFDADHNDGVGIWFTDQAQTTYPLAGIVNPQIENPSGNVGTDYYQELCGTFISDGTESWIVLGNFNTDANTTIENINGGMSGYVVVDTISLQEVCLPPFISSIESPDNFINCEDSCTQIIVNASGGDDDISYEWIENASGNNDTILVCPDETTSYQVVASTGDGCCARLNDTLSILIEKENCCPDSIVFEGPFEYCNDEIIEVIFNEDYLLDNTFLWSDLSVQYSYLSANLDCEPAMILVDVISTCINTPFNVYENTFEFTVYPDNLEPFYVGNFNDCDISAEVVVHCEDYINITVPPQIDPGDEGSFDFIITYVPDTECVDNDTLTAFYDCPECDLADLQIQGICNGIDSLTFDVYISFEGDNVYTILDSDGTIYQSNINSGNNIYIGAFPNLAQLTIIVRDELVGNCELATYIECVICDESSCYSEEGSISANDLNPCFGELVIADADDFLLMPKQSVWYLIHTLPFVDDNNLPDFYDDVYTTGSFLNNNNTTVPCGTTAYITAFGAQEDPNLSGYPDYNDICMTISNTIPINMLCPIGIATDEICNVVTGEFTYSFIITGGMPEFYDENYFVSGNYFNGVVGINELVTVGPISDGETYTINVTDSEGCTNIFEETILCEKLPVELRFFNGTVQNNNNLLFWETASEINIDNYILKKSEDGNDFYEIAIIEAAEDQQNGSRYEYIDELIFDKDWYYQLSETDLNNNTRVLGTIYLERKNITEQHIQFLPNPFKDQLEFEVTSPFNTQAKYLIYNANSKLIMSNEFQLFTGNNLNKINTENLTTGIYFIKVVFMDEIYFQKLIKK